MNDLRHLAAQLRVDSIRCTTEAGSGHPTSCLSAADLMAVLLANYLKYDWSHPHLPNNDRLIFSKGHACPLLYAMFKAAGVITDEELLSLRKFGSRLQGHPNPGVLPYVDVATGSLGQGLPIGVGMALSGKYLDKLPFRVWVLLGDSEMSEGSIWEAFEKASYYKLDHLIAILDMNRLGQRGETELGWDSKAYATRARAFGWRAIEVDGHDLVAIDQAYREALNADGQPICLIARTEKGHGFAAVADKENWHGKPFDPEQAKKAINALGGLRSLTIQTAQPEALQPPNSFREKALELPRYEPGSKEATRKAYGDALVAVGASRAAVVALDAEVSNSTFSEEFKHAFPERFFEMFIAEQQLVAAAVGLSVLGKQVYASTFAAFFTRAYDQIRMAAISNANLRLVGSHAGVSIGEDGPSQMGLEDLAMMRAVHGSTVLYPCDPNQTAQLVLAMSDLAGISYLRTTRAKTPVIYPSGESFAVGGSRILRQSARDQVTVVAAGITVHEALQAYETLMLENIAIRVIDAYSVKPMDGRTLRTAAQDTQGRIVVVEDHWPEGGLGDAVLDALADVPMNLHVTKLAVRSMPGSGKPEQLLDAAGINADHIVKAVKNLA
ncbi:transketolase [Oligoflexus tunisiensis]|uniref:transketolase n=1 Tax=Oligoflexus tunisiensis TaxID=708132 RepID=UPI000A45C09B|nr:transketolase [Oligoflexus tunisiensis]